MERQFIKHMAQRNDPEYAAHKAGYANPVVSGWKLKNNPAIQAATFAETQRFLRDQGAAIGVYTLAELAIDAAIPAGVRRAAASDLAKLSGVGVTDEAAGKEAHEMTLDELRQHQAKLERQRQAIERAISDQAMPIVDADPARDDVFG